LVAADDGRSGENRGAMFIERLASPDVPCGLRIDGDARYDR